MDLVSLLVSLLVLALILSIIWWIVGRLPFPQNIKNIILAIVGLIVLILLIQMLVGSGPPFTLRIGR